MSANDFCLTATSTDSGFVVTGLPVTGSSVTDSSVLAAAPKAPKRSLRTFMVASATLSSQNRRSWLDWMVADPRFSVAGPRPLMHRPCRAMEVAGIPASAATIGGRQSSVPSYRAKVTFRPRHDRIQCPAAISGQLITIGRRLLRGHVRRFVQQRLLIAGPGSPRAQVEKR